MDKSSPAAFVNAQLLPRYLNCRVRAAVQIVQSQGDSITGKSTDGRGLRIKHGLLPQFTTFVEVIGTAVNNNTIQAEVITNFGDTFGEALGKQRVVVPVQVERGKPIHVLIFLTAQLLHKNKKQVPVLVDYGARKEVPAPAPCVVKVQKKAEDLLVMVLQRRNLTLTLLFLLLEARLLVV